SSAERAAATMTVASIRLASCAGALSIAVAAHADFRAALADYNAGRYLAAHEQFQRLAELGDCSSQFNLGAMALKGQGGPKDSGSRVGWLRPALVITVLTIGADGLARDPEILLALPGEGFAASAVEAWLNSRFAPATRAGAPVESRLPAKLVFGVEGS